MSKIKLTLIPISALLLILTGCYGTNKESIDIVKYVKVETVASQSDNDKLIFNGKVKEQSLNRLSFRVGGLISGLNVIAGDMVKNGDIIASIDKRDYQLQVQSTKAQYEQLKGEYARYKELYSKEKIPANSYEKIESGFLMAKTAYSNAQNQLQDTELRAPFTGYIHEKFTENFQTVGPGQPIVSLIDLSKLEVVISVPENQLQNIKHSSQSYLTVDNARLSGLPLELVSISEKTGKDGMYKMKFSFKNDEELNVSPGMSAQVTLICNKSKESIVIPSTAIFNEKGTSYVWVYDQNESNISKRLVTIDMIENNGMVSILGGLMPNETIVTAGVHYLFDGQVVKPMAKAEKSNVGGLL